MKKIGIKLADGTFHPLLEEGVPDKTKIELSTVKDNQTTVKVDLYASEKSTMADAILIDTLQIADLEKQPNGQPDINLALSMDKNGNIEATLVDSDSKTRARSTINLEEALLASDKNPGTGKGLLKTAEEINERDNSAEKKIASELDDFNFDIPAFEGAAPKTEIVEDEPKAKKPAPAETVVESSAADETIADVSFEEPPVDDIPVDNVPLDEPVDESLDMPDFDVPAFEDSSSSGSDLSDSPASDDFELPDFDGGSDSSSDASFDDPFGDDFGSSGSAGDSRAAASSASSNLDFSDLYDDEDNEREEKKTRLPVLVCMVCAIICVLAVLLMLFIIPSRFNLINSRSSKTEVALEKVSEPLPPPAQKEEPLPPPEPVAPPAKEDEIVVVEEADIVVPDLPKVEEKREPKVITYKIKWGDTLWDISAAYYKNPWRYKKIARYNGIKNPNHIVAGTYIKIPEE